MNQRIHVGAIVVAEGRLLLISDSPGSDWRLVGTDLRPEHPDTETAMDEALAESGIFAPAIEEDYLETLSFDDDGSRLVYNLYAPTEWTGDPSPPPGGSLTWTDPHKLAELKMDPRLREALLVSFGIQARPDDADAALEALRAGAFRGTPNPSATAGVDPLSDALSLEFATRLSAFQLSGELQPRIGALVNLALSAAQRLPLRESLEHARTVGVTDGEIRGALRLVALYAGYPAALVAADAVGKAAGRHGEGGEP